MNKYLSLILLFTIGLGLVLIPSGIFGMVIKVCLFLGLFGVLEMGIIKFPVAGKFINASVDEITKPEPVPVKQKSRSVEDAFDDYVKSFLTTSKAMLKLHTAAFYLFHEGKKEFKFKYGISDHLDNLIKSGSLGTDKGLLHLMIKNKTEIIENNLSFEPRFLSYYENALNITGAAGLFPVFYKNTVVGAVIFDSQDPKAFQARNIDLAKKAILQMEQYFEITNALFELKTESERNTTFVQIANSYNKILTSDAIWDEAVHFVQKVIKYDRFIVSLTHTNEPKDTDLQYIKILNGMEGNYRIDQEFSLGDGIFAWCILNRRPFLLNDAFRRQTPVYLFDQSEKGALQTRSMVVMPIYSEEGVYGAMALESQYPYQFSDNDKLYLDFLGKQIASALERSARFDHLAALIQKDMDLGIWNYQSFIDKLSEEIGRSNRFNSTFSTVLFKFNFHSNSIMHSLEQPTRLIRETLSEIQKNSRQIDYFARLDQFHVVVLLYEANIEGAKSYADKVLNHVKESMEKMTGEQLVSLNACITNYPTISKGLDELVFSLKRGINISVENGPFSIYELQPK